MRSAPALLFVVGLTCGCQPTPEKIETWKGTQRGPQKLREVVADASAPATLRALAFTALVEIGMSADAEQGLVEPKAGVAHELVAPLASMLGDSVSKPVTATTAQLAAKDELFRVRAYAEPPDQARIDELLIRWTTTDLAARSQRGGESTGKILRAIGKPAAKALVPLVADGPDQHEAATLIGVLGDEVARNDAEARLEAIARSGPAGLSNVSEAALEAIGLVGGDKADAFLLEVANKAGATSKEKALFALALGPPRSPRQAIVDGVDAIAVDPHASGDVREAAFQAAEHFGASSVPGLMKAFHDPNQTARFRAIEAALKAGGPAGVGKVLAAIPEDKVIANDDFDSLLVHHVELLGRSAVPALVIAAAQKPAIGQLAAIRALGLLATKADTIDALTTSGPVKMVKPPTELATELARAKATAAARK